MTRKQLIEQQFKEELRQYEAGNSRLIRTTRYRSGRCTSSLCIFTSIRTAAENGSKSFWNIFPNRQQASAMSYWPTTLSN